MSKTVRLSICLGSSCFARGNKDNVRPVSSYISKNKLEGKVQFSGVRCFGQCQHGPLCSLNDEIIKVSIAEDIIKVLQQKLNEEQV